MNDVDVEPLAQNDSDHTPNWALAVAEGMEAANIDWIDELDASIHSRETYAQYLHEKWLRTQNPDA